MSEESHLIPTENKTTVLTELKSKQVLTKEDWKNLSEAKEFISDCFSTVPMYRPLPVKIFGVLNNENFPTPESKYWQCKVEAEVHSDQLIEDIHSLEIARINLERAECTQAMLYKKYENEKDENTKKEIEFDIREHSVEISRVEYKVIKLKKQIKYRISEIHEWKKISDKLKESNEGISESNYVKQYINTMKHKIQAPNPEENNSENDEIKNKQMESIERIINAVEEYEG